MKPASQAIRSRLSQQTGTEPFVALSINWGLGQTWYSSKLIPGYNNNIIKVSTLKNQKRADSMGAVASMNVTFSDTDGTMKFTIDNVVAEKKPIIVYLAYPDIDPRDWFPLIYGEVQSPISWNEGERTLTINIESKQSHKDYGYIATHTDFPDISPESEGIPWPSIFGSCAHVPALHFKRHTSGYLQADIRLFAQPAWAFNKTLGIDLTENPTVYCLLADPPEPNIIRVEGGSNFPQNQEIRILVNDVVFSGIFFGDVFFVHQANVPKYVNLAIDARQIGDRDNKNNQVIWLKDNTSIVNQHCYFHTAKDKTWYNYCEMQDGKKCWFRWPFVNPVTYASVLLGASNSIDATYCISKNGMSEDIEGLILKAKQAGGFRVPKNNPQGQPLNPLGALVARLTKMSNDANSWWHAEAETEVRLWDETVADIYIASLVPLTNIQAIYGKRRIKTFDDKTKTVFQPIPVSYCTVQYNSKYNNSTAIFFPKSLTDYVGQDWEDEIYVTGTSSIGPNACDVIKYIITNYTDLFVDGSFNTVRSLIASTPVNFPIFDKREAIKICSEIAFQCRCALLVDNGVVSIRFLAQEPVEETYFNEDNVELGSLELGFTQVTEMATKIIATWSQNYKDRHTLSKLHETSISEVEQIVRSIVPRANRRFSESKYNIYMNNIEAYGLHVREESFYCFNQESHVLTGLNFWGYRFSNVWRLVKLKTYMQGVLFQPFDGCILSFRDNSLINNNLMPAIIESLEFDIGEHTTTLELWLPARAGTFTVDPLAF